MTLPKAATAKNNLLTVISIAGRTLGLVFVCWLLATGVFAKTSRHSNAAKHSTRSLSSTRSRTKLGHASNKFHKNAVHHKVARSIEPTMPTGYQEKSSLLLKSYQLRKLAWNDTAGKNYDAAAANLHQAIALTQQCYGENSKFLLPIYLDLASAEQEANQLKQAAAALNECLKLDPAFTDASIKLALTKLQQGNNNEALTAGKQALKSAPQDPRTHMLMSLLLGRVGEANQAAQEKIEARKLYQSMPQIKTLPDNSNSSITNSKTSNTSTEQVAPGAQETEPGSQLPQDHADNEPDSELELP